MDNIQKHTSADQFLHNLGLRVDMNVIVRVLNVITRETPGSLYGLYSSAERRNGTRRTPICGKGTVYKIKRLYQTGELDSFLEFVHYKAHESDLNTLIAEFEQKKTGREARATFQKLIDDWESDIGLPLKFLDIEDLSSGIAGLDIGRETTLLWEFSRDNRIERRFGIEDKSDFMNLQKSLSNDVKLWGTFQECKQLGGSLIKECSNLINDIRKQSESTTGLKYMPQNQSGPDNPRLDRFFAWTIYADALNVLPEEHPDRTYRCINVSKDLGQISWGNFTQLAIVRPDMTDAIVQEHSKFRSRYRKSKTVMEILKLNSQYDEAEFRLRKEFGIVRQCLAEC